MSTNTGGLLVWRSDVRKRTSFVEDLFFFWSFLVVLGGRGAGGMGKISMKRAGELSDREFIFDFLLGFRLLSLLRFFV